MAMKNSNRTTFQMRLREVLTKHQLSQSELARRIDVTPQAVQRWCNGLGEPRRNVLERLANVTNTPLQRFFTPYPPEENQDLYVSISHGHVDEISDDRKQLLVSPDEEQLINIYRDLPGEERKNMLRAFGMRLEEINKFIERLRAHSFETKK